MQIVTPEQMKQIETKSEEFGVSRKQLMENAGNALAKIIDEYCCNELEGDSETKSVLFLAGSGNNGGDCYVAANKLVYKGYRVTLVQLCGKPQSDIAIEAYEKLPKDHMKLIKAYRSENVMAAIEAAELDYMTLSQENDLASLSHKKELTPLEKIRLEEKHRIERVIKAIARADVIADGVFGTGFHGHLDDEISAFLSFNTEAHKIAVDVPSGGNCETGTVSEGTFNADETIVFGALKTGHTQYPLKSFCGKITVADIGIPEAAYMLADGEREFTLIDNENLKGYPGARKPDSYKSAYGRTLIIAGSSRMRGAAALAAMSALRSGVGLVCTASAEEAIGTISTLAPESTFLPLESDDNGFILFDSNIKLIKSEMDKADSILIGSGMGVTPDTKAIMQYVAENAQCPVIIDADGINCIASDIDILKKKKTDIILTPHVGEMARLTGKECDDINSDRFAAASEFAVKYGVTVVLKGAGTVIADSHSTAVNPTGNPGMSKGGSGDILGGIVASLAAQGYDCYDAAKFAAYLHGLAGDIAADKFGQESMLPRDIIDCLSDSYRILNEMNEN